MTTPEILATRVLSSLAKSWLRADRYPSRVGSGETKTPYHFREQNSNIRKKISVRRQQLTKKHSEEKKSREKASAKNYRIHNTF